MKKPRARPSRQPTPTDKAPPHPETGPSVVHHVSAQWSGPLPPPATLKGFNDLVEGGAERVFHQFEIEAEHRRAIERQAIDLERDRVGIDREQKRTSQWLAGAFALGALGVAAYALSLGAFVTAGVIGGGSIAMVVAAFLGTRLIRGES